MTDVDLAAEVRELVSRRLQSMEEIDLLLLLAGERTAMTLDEICGRLRVPATTLLTAADRLVANELAELDERTEIRSYRYAPATSDLRRAVELLATVYNERPVTLVRLVYHRASVRSFNEVFRPPNER